MPVLLLVPESELALVLVPESELALALVPESELALALVPESELALALELAPESTSYILETCIDVHPQNQNVYSLSGSPH